MKKDTCFYYFSKMILWLGLLMLSITFFVYFREQIISWKWGWKSAALTTSFTFIIYTSINTSYYFWITLKKSSYSKKKK